MNENQNAEILRQGYGQSSYIHVPRHLSKWWIENTLGLIVLSVRVKRLSSKKMSMLCGSDVAVVLIFLRNETWGLIFTFKKTIRDISGLSETNFINCFNMIKSKRSLLSVEILLWCTRNYIYCTCFFFTGVTYYHRDKEAGHLSQWI